MGRSTSLLDLHYLGFFSARQGVDLLDLALGDLLQASMRSLRFVFRDVALLLHLIDPVQLVAADVADRDARLFRLLPDELHVLAPSLLGQRRDGDADHLAVVRRVEALVARAQRLLDRADLALVVNLDDEQPWLGSADLRELIERGRRAVVRDHDLVDERRVGAAGSDVGELRAEVVDRLAHLRLRLSQDRVDHVAAPTSVPTSSPSTTRSMLPGVRRLKTTIGTSLSIQSVRAVLSITSMPRLSTSR